MTRVQCHHIFFSYALRDRPFDLKGGGVMVFCFVQKCFFRTTRELEYLFFLSRKARIFFSRIQH